MAYLSAKDLSLEHSKILIIDSCAAQRSQLQKIMAQHGFNRIQEAEDSKAGLRKIREWRPNLIFLAMEMPEMNGLAICEQLQQDMQLHDMVILMQTAVENPNLKAFAFDKGVTDFISSTLDEEEVISRALAHLERNIVLQRKLRVDYQRIKEELQEAMILQTVLLPDEEMLEDIQNQQGLDIAHYYHPCSELGGDLLGVYKLSETRTALLTADISGHGITAALYAFVLHAIFGNVVEKQQSAGEMLSILNNTLYTLMVEGKFATMFLGIVDVEKLTLEYASAAAPPPILFAGKETTLLDTRGFLLGMDKDAYYPTHTLPFEQGDVLCLYSDALTETMDSEGNLMTEEELAEQLHPHLHEHASEILKGAVAKFLMEYSKKPDDDLSFLICKYT